MEKTMRNAPTLAVLVVMIIQVQRVSDFGRGIGAGWLSWVFALFLAGVIYVLSYWFGRTRYEITADATDPRQAAKLAQQKRMARIYGDARTASGAWLFVFIAIEGSLNWFETMQKLPQDVSQWQYAGAVVYGLFPTLAAFGLGSLQALIDRIPHGPAGRSGAQVLFDAFMRRIDPHETHDATHNAKNAAQETHDATHDARNTTHETHNAAHDAKNANYAAHPDAYPRTCPHGCGAELHSPQQYSAHIGRWCEVIKAKNLLNAELAQTAVELSVMTKKAQTS